MTCLLDYGSELLVVVFNITHVRKVGRFFFEGGMIDKTLLIGLQNLANNR